MITDMFPENIGQGIPIMAIGVGRLCHWRVFYWGFEEKDIGLALASGGHGATKEDAAGERSMIGGRRRVDED